LIHLDDSFSFDKAIFVFFTRLDASIFSFGVSYLLKNCLITDIFVTYYPPKITVLPLKNEDSASKFVFASKRIEK